MQFVTQGWTVAYARPEFSTVEYAEQNEKYGILYG